MATTLQQDINQALALLNEASSSSIAALPSGTSASSPTIASPDALTYWDNQARAHLARTCIALKGVGSLTRGAAVAGTTGILDVLLSTLTIVNGEVSGGLVWAARGVTWQNSGATAATSLKHCSLAVLEQQFPSWQVNPAAAAGPGYWYEIGAQNIGVYPYPAAAGTLAVAGMVTPPPLVNLTDADTWIPDDMQRLKTQWMAIQVILKNYGNDPLAVAKLEPYKAEWRDLATRQWAGIDEMTRQAHYKLPPSGVTEQQGPPDSGGG